MPVTNLQHYRQTKDLRPVTIDPRATKRLVIGGAHYWGSWRNGMEAARRLAHVSGQRVRVRVES